MAEHEPNAITLVLVAVMLAFSFGAAISFGVWESSFGAGLFMLCGLLMVLLLTVIFLD